MGFSVKDILRWSQGSLVNEKDLEVPLTQIRVTRPSSLGGSQSSDLAFFFSRAFEHELPTAQPGILITGEGFVRPLEAAQLGLWKLSAVISCKDPYFAMAFLSEKFASSLSSVAHLPNSSEGLSDGMSVRENGKSGVHPSAWVASHVEIERGVVIGPHCVVEEGVRIGPYTTLYSGCFIGPDCELGQSCVLFSNVTLYEKTQLGNRVRIHAGSVLGSDGFGYAPRREGGAVQGHQKIYHLGRVCVGDDVEIGANSCIDRATFGETKIGKYAKLDNLVHVGHNANVEEGAIICGGTCLAGAASIGKYVYIGGLTGVGNGVHIGDGARIGALSMVTKDVPVGGTAIGNPQRNHKEHFRAHALLNKLLGERKLKP